MLGEAPGNLTGSVHRSAGRTDKRTEWECSELPVMERVKIDPGVTLTPAPHGSRGPGQAGGALRHGLSHQVEAADALVLYAAAHQIHVLRVLRFTIKTPL